MVADRLRVLCLTACFALFAASAGADPYLALRAAYAKRDPAAAAAAYAPNAVYRERYEGAKPMVRKGRPAIEKGFAEIFAQFGPPEETGPLDLNFRFEVRAEGPDGSDTGFYRLSFRSGGDVQSIYGRFETARRGGVFVDDLSSDATRADFERLPGAVAYDADSETLDPLHYDRLRGRYRDAAGCDVAITRSMRRLFALDSCAKTWRALTRVDGETFTAGDAVWSDAVISTLRWRDGVLSIGARNLSAVPGPVRENVRFKSRDVDLAGAVYRPRGGPQKAPGVVLVHGSGPQDRHGYASLIDLLATRLAEKGVVVLTYDKRGVGGSGGDWSRAGFDALAADAAAGMAFLRNAPGVDPARVGIAGSSQAGWVAAQTVADGAEPAFVMLIGAAGAAVTVEAQNLYNTDFRMRCAGFDARSRRLALDQQKAFFAAKRDPKAAPRLVEATRKAGAVPRLSDWLFPSSVPSQPSGEWYDVLASDFDPLPIWRAFSGRKYFLFGEMDDSTPTPTALRRLAGLKNADVSAVQGAQHIGLRAGDLCKSDLEFVDGFHDGFWAKLDQWAEEIAAGGDGAR